MEKKVKRKFNFKRFIIFIIIIFLSLFSFYYLVNVKTKNILILNTNYYSDDIIIEKAGIENYPEFLLLNTSKLKDSLMELDLVSDVKIKKRFGFILEIDVTEKKVLYYIRKNDKYKVSDNKEYNLDKLSGYPILINYVPSDIEEEFVSKLSNIDSDVISLISEIEYSKISYDDERFLLYMIDGNEVYITISKMDKLNKYISIVSELDDKRGILYLDSGNYLEVKKK